MEDYKIMKQRLEDLRVAILNYKNDPTEKQDLMEQFFKVKSTSPETYDLLILIYNEFNLTNKTDKKQLLILLDKALNIKTQTVDKMLIERSMFFSGRRKLLSLLTWQNTKRAFILWASILIVLVTLHKLDKEAYNNMDKNFNVLVSNITSIFKKKDH